MQRKRIIQCLFERDIKCILFIFWYSSCTFNQMNEIVQYSRAFVPSICVSSLIKIIGLIPVFIWQEGWGQYGFMRALFFTVWNCHDNNVVLSLFAGSFYQLCCNEEYASDGSFCIEKSLSQDVRCMLHNVSIRFNPRKRLCPLPSIRFLIPLFISFFILLVLVVVIE